MDDKELLVLAAKAAKLRISYWGLPDYYSDKNGEVAYVTGYGEWHPLQDDGDALDLAARLRMEINWHTAFGETRALCCARLSGFQAVQFYGGEDDRMEATRRAIVEVAAQMGRAK